MPETKHKVFISYHHASDQVYKEALLSLNAAYDIFIDASVDTGDINENLDDQSIRQLIRDGYLRDSTVTIVLVGADTKNRKHVDWEIYSSMYDGTVNKKSGVLVIQLPVTGCTHYFAAHGMNEKRIIYPENSNWVSVDTRTDCELRHPYIPDRIIDNLIQNDVKISVTNWDVVTGDVEKLRFLIDETFNDRTGCNYELSLDMRRANS